MLENLEFLGSSNGCYHCYVAKGLFYSLYYIKN